MQSHLAALPRSSLLDSTASRSWVHGRCPQEVYNLKLPRTQADFMPIVVTCFPRCLPGLESQEVDPRPSES